jgi:hypothetical protein
MRLEKQVGTRSCKLVIHRKILAFTLGEMRMHGNYRQEQ